MSVLVLPMTVVPMTVVPMTVVPMTVAGRAAVLLAAFALEPVPVFVGVRSWGGVVVPVGADGYLTELGVWRAAR
jgi:hypothetical protein